MTNDWRKEFRKRTLWKDWNDTVPDNPPPFPSNNLLRRWFNGRAEEWPEQAYELDPEKVEQFIAELLEKQRIEVIEAAAETFRRNTEGLTHATCNKPLQLGYIYQEIQALKQTNND